MVCATVFVVESRLAMGVIFFPSNKNSDLPKTKKKKKNCSPQ
jgi:hypothetical protein